MGILNRLQAYGSWLMSDPIGFVIYLLYFATSILLTLVLHEVAHGFVAYRCGDPTAKMLGRLSLDPRKHLDPVGTLCMVFLGFGWARPVPVNPRNFRNYRRDDFLVSVAGITVNLTLFLVTISLAVGINGLLWRPEVAQNNSFMRGMLDYGIFEGNLFQSGSANGNQFLVLMRYPWLRYVQRFLLMFASMNLSIGIFNLLPIPPLDGFHLLNDTLLKGRFSLSRNAFQIAQVVLLLLCFTGVLTGFLSTVINGIEDSVIHLLLLMTGRA
ncbi:MAG: site-2 protease family protein [Clostridia bacterium]